MHDSNYNNSNTYTVNQNSLDMYYIVIQDYQGSWLWSVWYGELGSMAEPHGSYGGGCETASARGDRGREDTVPPRGCYKWSI